MWLLLTNQIKSPLNNFIMIFLVSFIAKNDYAAKIEQSEAGTEIVDMIRIEAGHKVPLPVINAHVSHVCIDPSIELTEDLARASGHYANANIITVNVPEKFLNAFAFQKPVVVRNDDGLVHKAFVRYELDNDAVLSAWANAGYPLQWGFDEPVNTASN